MKINYIKFIIFFSVLLFSSVTCSCKKNTEELNPPYTYYEEEVNFNNCKDGARLAGTLTIPNSQGGFPAVVLISGSGLQDRDETTYGHKPFKILAEYLTRNNIAVLRYDDRGAGKSIGPMDNLTPENFAADAYSGLQFLKSRNDLNINKVGLIGHSMGAVEGSILASRTDDVSFLVMLGGAGIPLDKNMLKSDSVNNTRSGKSEDEIMSGQILLRNMIAEVKKGHSSDITEINLKKILDDWRSSLSAQVKGPIDEFSENNPDHWRGMASEWSTPYFRYVLTFDPYPVLKNISCPVLSLIGEKDVQTLPEENSLRIKEALENGKCQSYQVEILRDINHLFQKCEIGIISEYAHIEETFNVAAMRKISNWIAELAQ